MDNANKINLIYILGTSFSGSTILGYILGSSNKVFNAGELKYFNRIKKVEWEEICTCGQKSLNCPFWSPIFKKNYKIFGIPDILSRLKIIVSILTRRHVKAIKLPEKKDFQDFELLTEVFMRGKKLNRELVYILDPSKSIWRLIYLLNHPKLNIKIIYLERGIEGNTSSFIKHKMGFWRGLFIHKLNNYLIRKFLEKNKLDVIHINYEALCQLPKKHLNKISNFLDIDYSNYIEDIKKRKFHIPNGNLGTRKQFISTFDGLRYDDSWRKRLSKFQLKIIKIIS